MRTVGCVLIYFFLAPAFYLALYIPYKGIRRRALSHLNCPPHFPLFRGQIENGHLAANGQFNLSLKMKAEDAIIIAATMNTGNAFLTTPNRLNNKIIPAVTIKAMVIMLSHLA